MIENKEFYKLSPFLQGLFGKAVNVWNLKI